MSRKLEVKEEVIEYFGKIFAIHSTKVVKKCCVVSWEP